MPIYEFRCQAHGVFEQRLRMAEAGREHACPICREPAPRHYAVPMLARLSPDARTALDHADKTRHDPDVVNRIPTRSRNDPAITRNPKHYKLPRP